VIRVADSEGIHTVPAGDAAPLTWPERTRIC
jgi:hypothetical protein